MVAKLEQKTWKNNPDDLKGWLMLGRSYLASERPDAAIRAYERAHLRDAQATRRSCWGLGEAMSLRAGGEITPEAAQLFEDAAATWRPKIPRRCSTPASRRRCAATAPRRAALGGGQGAESTAGRRRHAGCPHRRTRSAGRAGRRRGRRGRDRAGGRGRGARRPLRRRPARRP